MPLTNDNYTNPPTYEPGGDNGSEDNEVNDNDDIVPTPGSNIEEPMLALPLCNWRACRCNLEKDLTGPENEEEKAAWYQYLIQVRK